MLGLTLLVPAGVLVSRHRRGAVPFFVVALMPMTMFMIGSINPSGISDVSYSGVTAQLEPESVILRDPSGKVALSVVEQSYRGDPVDQQRLLQMFEGQTIRFLKVVDGKELIESGKIIRAPSMITTIRIRVCRGGRLLGRHRSLTWWILSWR